MTQPTLFCGFSISMGGALSRLEGDLIRDFEDGGGDAPNHAFLFWQDPPTGAWLTRGANARGIEDLEMSVFLKDRAIVRVFAPKFDLWADLRLHVADLGEHYNYRGLFGMAFVEILERLRKRPCANLLSARDEVFCSEWISELVRDALKLGGHPWIALPDDAIDPATLAAAMATAPTLFDEQSPKPRCSRAFDGYRRAQSRARSKRRD